MQKSISRAMMMMDMCKDLSISRRQTLPACFFIIRKKVMKAVIVWKGSPK